MVDLQCKRLTELHVAGNKLMTFPRIETIPMLEVLDVSNNMIAGPLSPLVSGDKKLRVLKIAGNQFDYSSRPELLEQLDILNRLPGLVELDLRNNPFTRVTREYRTVVIGACPRMEVIDDRKVERQEVAVAVEMIRRTATRVNVLKAHSSSSDSDESDDGNPDAPTRKLFGLTLTAVAQMEKTDFPGIVDECVAALEKKNSPVMFVADPPSSEVTELRRVFELDPHQGGERAQKVSPEVVASVLKDFFRSLVEPPIPLWAHRSVLEACLMKTNRQKLIHIALGKLPPANRPTIARVCAFLQDYIALPQVSGTETKGIWANLLLGKSDHLDPQTRLTIVSELFIYGKYVDENGSVFSFDSGERAMKDAEDEKRSQGTKITGSSDSESGSDASGSEEESDEETSGSESGSGSGTEETTETGSETASATESMATSKSGSSASASQSASSESGSRTSGSQTVSSKSSDAPVPPLKKAVSRSSVASSKRRSSVSSSQRKSSVRQSPTSTHHSTDRSRASDVDDNLGIVVKNKKSVGTKVVMLIGGSPAERIQKIDVHDYILSINGITVAESDAKAVQKLLREFQPGQSVKIEIERTVGAEKQREVLAIVASQYKRIPEDTIYDYDAPDFSSGFRSTHSDDEDVVSDEFSSPRSAGSVPEADDATPAQYPFTWDNEVSSTDATDVQQDLYSDISSRVDEPQEPSKVVAQEQRPAVQIVTTVGMEKLAAVAPKAAAWMERLDRWTDMLSRSKDNLSIKTELLDNFQDRVHALITKINQTKQAKQPEREVNQEPKKREDEGKVSKFPFVWDDLSTDPESTAEFSVGMSRQAPRDELKARLIELKTLSANKEKLKILLRKQMQRVSQGAQEGGKIVVLQTRAAKLAEDLQQEQEQLRVWTREKRKLQSFLDGQEAKLTDVQHELDVQAKLERMKQGQNVSDEKLAEKVLKSKVEMEAAQEQLEAARAQLRTIVDETEGARVRSTEIQQRNDILRAEVERLLSQFTESSKAFTETESKVADLRAKADLKRSDVSRDVTLSNQLRAKLDEISYLKLKVKMLQDALKLAQEI
eukprot:c17990_g1_i1.p1 GENE.c17990_g1_i1~~c17990_g1_i1.p1  ORF type:complete len:1179 (+),score=230.14 c17990_g1_i1:360-3539(+)